MRISRYFAWVPAALVLPVALVVMAATPARPPVAERSAVAAYNAARQLLIAGDLEHALPELQVAANRGIFLADYYLALLYAMDRRPFTDHVRSFRILKRLVNRYGAVDPYTDNHAPFVAKAEVLLARYYRMGLPGVIEGGDVTTAKAHLEHAALRLQDTDAQFELAVLDLENPDTIARGLDALDNLAVTKQHALAAARMAEIYSRGKLVEARPAEALAYAVLAMQFATESDRLWIGQTYQNVFCSIGQGDRDQARTIAEGLLRNSADAMRGQGGPRHIRGRKTYEDTGIELGSVDAMRVCGNGEVVANVGSAAFPREIPLVQPDEMIPKPKSGFVSLVGYVGAPGDFGLRDLETPRSQDQQSEDDDTTDAALN
jgi:TPR repeat protein